MTFEKRLGAHKWKNNADIWGEVIPGNENSNWTPEAYLMKKYKESCDKSIESNTIEYEVRQVSKEGPAFLGPFSFY